MDFVSDNFLNSKNVNENNIQIYFKFINNLFRLWVFGASQ